LKTNKKIHNSFDNNLANNVSQSANDNVLALANEDNVVMENENTNAQVDSISPDCQTTLLIESNMEAAENDRLISSCSSEIKQIINENTKPEEVVLALLVTFFKCKLSQDAFNKIIQLIQLFTNLKLPTTIAQCICVLEINYKEQLVHEKQYYCDTCQSVLTKLSYSKQRNCSTCNKK
jgi:hypothetical protein